MLKGRVEVEITVWSFLVMLTSIVIDWSRSRALYRVARETNSHALEADALHFETDIWSSAVVIIGLICVKAAEWAPAVAWLRHADAVAALAVAVIAAVVTVRLGARTVEALMDAAPANMEDRISAESVCPLGPGKRNAGATHRLSTDVLLACCPREIPSVSRKGIEVFALLLVNRV
jgi:divalent metal cation (Fe/Co/Zn/Cd) transporter